MLMWWLNASTRQWISIQAVITAGFCKAERRFRYCHNFIRHNHFWVIWLSWFTKTVAGLLQDFRLPSWWWGLSPRLITDIICNAIRNRREWMEPTHASSLIDPVRRVRMSGYLQETHGIRSEGYPLIHRGIFLYWIWNSN